MQSCLTGSIQNTKTGQKARPGHRAIHLSLQSFNDKQKKKTLALRSVEILTPCCPLHSTYSDSAIYILQYEQNTTNVVQGALYASQCFKPVQAILSLQNL